MEDQKTTEGQPQVGSDALLSLALRAICLTRDYVGEGLLPAIKGWDWFDAGSAIAEAIPNDDWAAQFSARVATCRTRSKDNSTDHPTN